MEGLTRYVHITREMEGGILLKFMELSYGKEFLLICKHTTGTFKTALKKYSLS